MDEKESKGQRSMARPKKMSFEKRWMTSLSRIIVQRKKLLLRLANNA